MLTKASKVFLNDFTVVIRGPLPYFLFHFYCLVWEQRTGLEQYSRD